MRMRDPLVWRVLMPLPCCAGCSFLFLFCSFCLCVALKLLSLRFDPPRVSVSRSFQYNPTTFFMEDPAVIPTLASIDASTGVS